MQEPNRSGRQLGNSYEVLLTAAAAKAAPATLVNTEATAAAKATPATTCITKQEAAVQTEEAWIQGLLGMLKRCAHNKHYCANMATSSLK